MQSCAISISVLYAMISDSIFRPLQPYQATLHVASGGA